MTPLELNNELLIDQILSYTVQAGEILQNDFLSEKKLPLNYTYLFLPSGPELYTGPLKAAGYLLLDSEIKKLILIKRQSTYPQNITIYAGKQVIVLGKTFHTAISRYPKGLIKTTDVDEEIRKQLIFVRLLKEIDEVIMLGVGDQLKAEDISKVVSAIQGKKSPYGVVLYDTCSQEMPMEEGKKLDEYLLRHVLLQKSTTKKSKRLGNSFSHITKQAKHKPDIIGYFNSGDFGAHASKCTGYVCIGA